MKPPPSLPLSRRAFLTQGGAAGALALGLLQRSPSLLAATAPDQTGTRAWPRATVDKFYISTIWSDGRHNAFPGIARVGDYYYVTFRHAESHAMGPAGSAKIFVIRAPAGDLKSWSKVAEFTHEHDARDPLVFDNRGKVQVVYHSREDFYSQSADGLTWTTPRELDTEIVQPPPGSKLVFTSTRRWLFRIRRGPDGAFYSLGRCGIPAKGSPGKFGLILYRSEDGVKFKALHAYGEGPIQALAVGRGTGHEADVGWAGDGTFLAAIRNSRNDGIVAVGPLPLGPFRALTTGTMTFGGPALHTTRKGGVLVAGRHASPQSHYACRVSTVMPDGVDNHVILPSGGDCAYQSFEDGPGESVLLAYYSSHEYPQPKGTGNNPTNIYLAHLTVRHQAPK
jgi:hypothetical protein